MCLYARRRPWTRRHPQSARPPLQLPLSSQTLTAAVEAIDGLSALGLLRRRQAPRGPDGKLYLTRGDEGDNWLANACYEIRSQELPTAAEIRAKDWTNIRGRSC